MALNGTIGYSADTFPQLAFLGEPTHKKTDDITPRHYPLDFIAPILSDIGADVARRVDETLDAISNDASRTTIDICSTANGEEGTLPRLKQ